MTALQQKGRPADSDLTEDPEVAGLVVSARAGDELAFTELYRAFAPRVYRFCSFRVARSSDAEDLTQLTFMKVIEALPRYEQRAPFGAWIFRIARNVVIDFERSRHLHVDLDDLVIRGAEGTIDDGLAGADDRDSLIRAMRRLTREQRDVIVYRFFADLSARDTGLLMNRDEATIRALQARAIGALRRALAAAPAGGMEAAPAGGRRRPIVVMRPVVLRS